MLLPGQVRGYDETQVLVARDSFNRFRVQTYDRMVNSFPFPSNYQFLGFRRTEVNVPFFLPLIDFLEVII